MSSGGAMGHIALSKASVLYLGSAVPLETAVGIEAIQLPCRERYGATVSPDHKVSGIDATLTVFSSGILMQYTGNMSTTWFPMQTLHVSAAVKAVSGIGDTKFLPLDLPEAEDAHGPSLFCCITRRTKGIKILECHVFICKSTEAAMTLVQSSSYAFERREGWLPEDSIPPGPLTQRNVMLSGSGLGAHNGGFKNGTDAVQKYSVTSNGQCNHTCGNETQTHTCQQNGNRNGNGNHNGAAPQPTSNSSATCSIDVLPLGGPIGGPLGLGGPPGLNQYFSNWNAHAGQSAMFMPGSPFYPGHQYMCQQNSCCYKPAHHCTCKKKKKKKKKKKSKKKDCDSESEEEEIFYIRKPQEKANPPPPPREPRDFVVFAPQTSTNLYTHDPSYGLVEPAVDYFVPPEYDLTYGYDPAVAPYAADPYGLDPYAADPYASDPYAADPYGPDPYDYYGGEDVRGYNDLVDDLGYYP